MAVGCVLSVQVLGLTAAQAKIARAADRLAGRPLTIREQLDRLALDLAGVIDETQLRWHLSDGRKADQTIAVTVAEQFSGALPAGFPPGSAGRAPVFLEPVCG